MLQQFATLRSDFTANVLSPAAEGVIGQQSPQSTDQSSFRETPTTSSLSLFALLEFILKDQAGLNRLLRSTGHQQRSIPILLAIGLGGAGIFSITLALIYSCAGIWPEFTPLADWLDHADKALVQFVPVSEADRLQLWTHGPALHVVLSYALGLAGAIGICLPSFYFYSLLAGVRTSMLHVATCALNALASGAVAVLGALPIYLVLMLGLVIAKAPSHVMHLAALVGLLLPFIAGLYGTRALYLSFMDLADTMAEDRRPAREAFLRLLLIAWSTCYSLVTPVMIMTIWVSLARFHF